VVLARQQKRAMQKLRSTWAYAMPMGTVLLSMVRVIVPAPHPQHGRSTAVTTVPPRRLGVRRQVRMTYDRSRIRVGTSRWLPKRSPGFIRIMSAYVECWFGPSSRA